MHRRREARILAGLEQSPRMRAVALVADTFQLDPIVVSEEPDPFKRLVRIAAHNVVQAETRKAQKRAGG